jgi:hypothetical protein
MIHKLPGWVIRKAGPEDRSEVQDAFANGTAVVRWPETNYLRSWAKQRGWPAPILGFHEKFTRKFLSTDENYYYAISGSGIEIQIPVRQHEISARELRKLDELYESRGNDGRPDCWGPLVEGLREIRRACEANVRVIVEGKTLNARNFYSWAHGRYHMLEDGYDKWIGSDD